VTVIPCGNFEFDFGVGSGQQRIASPDDNNATAQRIVELKTLLLGTNAQ
jgi:hypothetical protein